MDNRYVEDETTKILIKKKEQRNKEEDQPL